MSKEFGGGRVDENEGEDKGEDDKEGEEEQDEEWEGVKEFNGSGVRGDSYQRSKVGLEEEWGVHC